MSNVYSLILVCCSVASVFSYGTRLVSKHNNSYMGVEGIVQVQVNNTWSYLNGSDWGFVDALVSCRELGFKGVASFDSHTTRCVFATGEVDTPCSTHMISVVKCHGSERGMGECTLNDLENLFTDGDMVNMSRHGGVAYIHNAAQVSCTGFQAVRLSGGSEGKVEVFFNNTWKTICGQSWSKPDADVLCRQLGYPESVSGSETFSDKTLADNSSCSGNKTDLMLCIPLNGSWGTTDCDHEAVTVRCKDHLFVKVTGSPSTTSFHRRHLIIGFVIIGLVFVLLVTMIVLLIGAAYTRNRKSNTQREANNNEYEVDDLTSPLVDTIDTDILLN